MHTQHLTKTHFEFQRANNYFSKKFSTLLQETRVVVIGYSLNDMNLNYILNEVKNPSSYGYYIYRGKIDSFHKDYYYDTFGMKVIDETDIETFFKELIEVYREMPRLKKWAESLKSFMTQQSELTDDFVLYSESMQKLLESAHTSDIDYSDVRFQNVLLKLCEKKREYTYSPYAWEQYADFGAKGPPISVQKDQ